jgi:Transcriptional regulators
MPSFGEEMRSFEAALDVMFRECPGMTLGAALALVKLVRFLPDLAQGTTNLRDVAQEMDIPYSTLLRYTDHLSEGAKATAPLYLLEKGMHPSDKRARQLRLTDKGEALLREVEQALAGLSPSHAPSP